MAGKVTKVPTEVNDQSCIPHSAPRLPVWMLCFMVFQSDGSGANFRRWTTGIPDKKRAFYTIGIVLRIFDIF